jgi:hypothetical protein
LTTRGDTDYYHARYVAFPGEDAPDSVKLFAWVAGLVLCLESVAHVRRAPHVVDPASLLDSDVSQFLSGVFDVDHCEQFPHQMAGFQLVEDDCLMS